MISVEQIAYMLELMYSEASLREQMGTKGHRFLIAMAESRPVAFAGFEHHYQGDPRTRLHKLYALPAIQGIGVGSKLLEAVLSEARKAGDTAIELNVNKRNASLGFYRHHGFTIERDEVLDIGRGFVMDDHVMVRTL
jgi:GNAT superfamily N-acetyltransferase